MTTVQRDLKKTPLVGGETREAGGDVSLVVRTREIASIVETFGLDALFCVYATCDEALRELTCAA